MCSECICAQYTGKTAAALLQKHLNQQQQQLQTQRPSPPPTKASLVTPAVKASTATSTNTFGSQLQGLSQGSTVQQQLEVEQEEEDYEGEQSVLHLLWLLFACLPAPCLPPPCLPPPLCHSCRTMPCCVLSGGMVDAEDYSTPQPQFQSAGGPLKRYMGPTRVVPKVGQVATGAAQADQGLQASQDMNMNMNGPAMIGKPKPLLGKCRQPSCHVGHMCCCFMCLQMPSRGVF